MRALQINLFSAKRASQRIHFRYITVLYYLNDDYKGGETAFPLANNVTVDLRVSPLSMRNRKIPCVHILVLSSS